MRWLAHKSVKQFIFLCLFLYADVWLWHIGFFVFGFLNLRHNGSSIHRSKVEAFHNTADFRCVLGTGNHINLGFRVFVFTVCQNAVENAVFFRFLRKAFQVLVLNGKDFQLLARTEHTRQPCFTFGFLFFFENGIQKHGDILRTCSCQFCGNLKSL